MGRHYLPATRVIPRATSYPAHAFPEALQILEQFPLNYPLRPPMFDLEGLVLPWYETIDSEVPNTSVIIRYQRDLKRTFPSFCTPEPPVNIYYQGRIVYQVECWPEDTTFVPPTYPNPAYVVHKMFITWDNWPATGWGYRQIWGTLEGLTDIAGWNMNLYQTGLAAPLCTDSWILGWDHFVVVPAPWDVVNQRVSYSDYPVVEV